MMLLLCLLGLMQAGLIHGHYEFTKIVLNGNIIGGDYEYIRPQSNGAIPMYSNRRILNSTDLRCNRVVKPSTATKTLTVTAGDKVGFKLGYGGLIDHPGPGLVYLSKAPESGVTTYDGSGDWFKIYENGNCAAKPGAWNPEITWCLYNSDRIEVTIPKTLPSGQYLARVEMLALHNARAGEVQIYAECAQLNVISTGGGIPGPMAKIPGVYSANDPGLIYDIYTSTQPYPMPGPKLWLQ